MSSALPQDNERIKRIKDLLAGDADDIAEGLNQIDKEYRYRICGKLRWWFPGALPQDLPEIWQDTLWTVYRMTTNGRFRQSGSIYGLLCRVAFYRGQDFMRRHACWQRPVEALMAEHNELQSVESWQAIDFVQVHEVVEAIYESIEQLPPRQKQVWQVYVDHFPESTCSEHLVTKVREAADHGEPTRKAVSNALYEGRKRIITDLKSKGYHL